MTNTLNAIAPKDYKETHSRSRIILEPETYYKQTQKGHLGKTQENVVVTSEHS